MRTIIDRLRAFPGPSKYYASPSVPPSPVILVRSEARCVSRPGRNMGRRGILARASAYPVVKRWFLIQYIYGDPAV